ncbi:MAG: cation:proton antiporter [Actinomycetaceae bacterium]|nr:cation:proton antiporter [Actinomycetaceae bacterium]
MPTLLVVTLLIALVAGMTAKGLGLPPMIGFLATGYVLFSFGMRTTEGLEMVSGLGVTALLFTIGLQLDLKQLTTPLVAGVGFLHMGAWTLVSAGMLMVLKASGWTLLTSLNFSTALVIGLALAFSSTVYVVKLLDTRGQLHSRYGSVSISVLVVQDIVAVVLMSLSAKTTPSIYALSLLATPLLYWPIKWLLNKIGHGELLVLAGLALGFGGYFLFAALGLKGDLGALVVGVLVSYTAQAREMNARIGPIKELLLIAFFVEVGLRGLPNIQLAVMALMLLAVLPLKSLVFLLLFRVFRAAPRLSAMSSATLTNYSEFALVIASLAVAAGWLSADWLSAIAIAVAGSFVGSAIVFRYDSRLLTWVMRQSKAGRAELNALHLPESALQKLPSLAGIGDKPEPWDFSNSDAIVLGMGRVGKATYYRLANVYGLKPVGIESDLHRLEKLRSRGAKVFEGDATDPNLWEAFAGCPNIRFVLSTVPICEDHDNIPLFTQFATRRIKIPTSEKADSYRLVVACRYPDQKEVLLRAGADEVVYIYGGAGAELADLAVAHGEFVDHSQAQIEDETKTSVSSSVASMPDAK